MKKFMIGAALIGLFATVGTGVASQMYGKRRDAGRNRTSSNGCFTCCQKPWVEPSSCNKNRPIYRFFRKCCIGYNQNGRNNG